MGICLNLLWKKYWTLTVIEFAWMKEHHGTRNTLWKCRCDCGEIRFIDGSVLNKGKQTSCWCLQRKNQSKRLTTHWLAYTHFYRKFMGIKTRCNNKNNKHYKEYWGKGIKCERNSFEEYKSDMYESYLKHVEEHWERQTTIDRINNDWNYSKENCRWATVAEQNGNQTSTIILEHNGMKKNLFHRATYYKVPHSRLYYRISRWWNPERIFADLDKNNYLPNK